MKRLLAAIGCGILLTLPAPAQAGPTTDIKHHNPDAGYNAPFYAHCITGANVLVGVGQNSRNLCGSGISQIIVSEGQEIWCWNTGSQTWTLWLDATGVHNVNWGGAQDCVSQAD